MTKRFASALLLPVVLILTTLPSSAQSEANPADRSPADRWYAGREWLNGLTARPADVVNSEEFARQYRSSKAAWDKAFEFLKNTDFSRLRAGKYPIDDENVYALITEGPAREIAPDKWEAHLNYNDIHYVIRGKEKIGILPVEQVKSQVAVAYSPEKDIAFYRSDTGRFHLAEPGLFYVITTKEAHNPGNRVEGVEGVKKVVVKVRNAP
ncbi:YhcH/YjgK/YiaL family protein [Larkinella soli]|uniref:YhcH/YjgK/YiaL family protein n=1 Tax=Larkinella soli TaxID=1770527 RepID=UPI000FFB47C7|nr:YhcH/YjgK/YiaL family protein [Larkinella soli]